MLFERLHRLGSKADRLLLYPSQFELDANETDGRLLRKARDEYNVKLKPIEVLQRHGGDATWAESYTKLLAFNQTQYTRVLQLDSDSTLLKTMDELFLLPPVPLAIPRAYWLNHSENVLLNSQLMLLQPSDFEYARISKAMETAGPKEYDMEIVDKLYKESALILPHRPYTMLTTEFRYESHKDYMGNEEELFDPERVFAEVKFLHFSDWPMPKVNSPNHFEIAPRLRIDSLG
ncbi:MAG: hypothetical protein Q9169_006753 [Polycauliona sp. 2 TL-2023]